MSVAMNTMMMRRRKRMAEIGCVVAIVHSAPVPVREESGNAVVLVTLKLYY